MTRPRASFNHHPTSDAFTLFQRLASSEPQNRRSRKALIDRDKRLLDENKGGQRPAASPTDKPGNLEQVLAL